MTMKFKKHVNKYRGKRTHGFGRQQGRRKTGRKHGHGLTTGWQKGQKSYMVKQKSLGFPTQKYGKKIKRSPWKFGKHGFSRPQTQVRIYRKNFINIGSLNAKLDGWVKEDLAQKSGDTYSVDLDNLNIQKILAKGSITKKVQVRVRSISEYAKEEIEKAGGKVFLIES
ncbi:MAG: uL15 family ribosomal protein [Candidatus Lokiarchaeota archaeon]|nr:uL15 family ribosomal protein [Candidatus Lokiarchaeota archaeon]